MKKIALIGSTGSIGKQVLSVVRRHSDRYKIVTMSGGENSELFLSQVREFEPKIATCKNVIDAEKRQGLGETDFYFGECAFLNAITCDVDVVVVALVGFIGLVAVDKAIELGLDIALANKESLVVGGGLLMQKAKEKGVTIVPIDSEHSALWQALNFDFNKPYKRLILTASGGAFRDLDKSALETVTAKDALKHPNWDMGNKITIDCATLVNKGFEVIEAKWLYNASFDDISVIIHRESIIHSMVEFNDNSVIAQMSYPTMELPIQLALSYPDRLKTDIDSLDFAKLRKLSFEEPDHDKFPCLNLIIEAGKRGNGYPAVANGANEQAVRLFLEDKIAYNDIYKSIDGALNAFSGIDESSVENLSYADKFSRDYVKNKFGV